MIPFSIYLTSIPTTPNPVGSSNDEKMICYILSSVISFVKKIETKKRFLKFAFFKRNFLTFCYTYTEPVFLPALGLSGVLQKRIFFDLLSSQQDSAIKKMYS